jgi:hypothetical protein
VDEAALVVLERAHRPLGPEDAVDVVAVEVGQEVADHGGEVVERRAGGPAQLADDGALLLVGLPGRQLGRSGRGSPRARAGATSRTVSVPTP